MLSDYGNYNKFMILPQWWDFSHANYFAIIYLDHSLKLYRKNLRGPMICW